MEPLVVITLKEFEDLKKKVENKSEREKDLELGLYWAIRILEGEPEHFSTFNRVSSARGLVVVRKGATVKVERVPLGYMAEEKRKDI